MALHDTNLPAGAIVERFEDGGALRNDGVRLQPASQNPWYVLATVAGEQSNFFDADIQKENRRFWNGWMCQGLDDDTRKSVAEKMGLPIEEFRPLENDDLDFIRNRFTQHFEKAGSFSEIYGLRKFVNLANTYFSGNSILPLWISFSHFYFPDGLNLANSHFSWLVDFSDAYSNKSARFDKALFSETAKFSRFKAYSRFDFSCAVFLEDSHFNEIETKKSVNFHGVNFRKYSIFRSCNFEGFTDFSHTKFCSSVDFHLSKFTGETVFRNASFLDSVRFNNTIFSQGADFGESRYDKFVPNFLDCSLQQGTTFTKKPAYWPVPNKNNAQWGEIAYTRLRKFAADNHNPDLEHFFLRQEMACKEVLDKSNRNFVNYYTSKAFGCFADYGNSFAWPAFWLAVVWGSGWGVIGSYLKYCKGYTNPIGDGLMIALGNTLPFLNISEKMHQDFYEHAPWWLDFLSALQSIFGIILIFFIALGLRNRFRLK